MNMQIELAKMALNSIFLAHAYEAVSHAVNWDFGIRMRYEAAKDRERGAKTFRYDDFEADEAPEIVDTTAYGMSIIDTADVPNELWRPYSGDDYRRGIHKAMKAYSEGRLPFILSGVPEDDSELEAVAEEIDRENALHDTLSDIDDDEDLQIHADDFHCVVEKFENTDDREYAPGLYS